MATNDSLTITRQEARAALIETVESTIRYNTNAFDMSFKAIVADAERGVRSSVVSMMVASLDNMARVERTAAILRTVKSNLEQDGDVVKVLATQMQMCIDEALRYTMGRSTNPISVRVDASHHEANLEVISQLRSLWAYWRDDLMPKITPALRLDEDYITYPILNDRVTHSAR